MADSIKVAVRVRSFNQRELDLGCSMTVSMSGVTTTLSPNLELEGTSHNEPSTFTFDFSWWSFDPSSPEYASQETIMKDVGEEILDNAMSGFNGCLFAYGQTGSGKTYSVIGYKDAPGIIPRLISRIFVKKNDFEADPKQELRIWASYIEIYNEEVHDLLAKQDDHELRLMDHPRLGVLVRDLHEVPCQTAEELTSLMDMGVRKRAVGATRMNATSSRSHTVFTLKVQRLQGEKPKPGVQDNRVALNAKMNFVDLAGSERLSKTCATGVRRREAANINQSLSALARIIKDLGIAMVKAEEHGLPPPSGKDLGHLSWRSSKLTFLLRDSLAGNSKTFMIAAISPASDNWEETLSTLEFAASVKKIKTSASKNELAEGDLIEKMKGELQELRKQVNGSETDHLHKIKEEERLIEEMTRDFESQRLRTQELLDSRSKATEDMTLSQDELNKALGLEPSTPYLVNMSDDPALAGCLFYCLPANGGVLIGGSDTSCAIRVPGPAIPKQLCEIKRESNEKVSVRRLAQGRVQVNGRALQENISQELANGCRLALGRSVIVKLVMPSATKMHEEDQLVLQDLEREWACIEDSPSWGKLQVGLDDLMKEMSIDEAKNITRMAEEVVHMCEEANEITAECRAVEGLHFEAHLVVTPPASVGVRVLKTSWDYSAGPECSAKECSTFCIYYWTIDQMHERLEQMRAYYLSLSRSGRPPVVLHSLNDPWFQPSVADVALFLAELEEAKQEKAMLLVSTAKAETEANDLRGNMQVYMEAQKRADTSEEEATRLQDLLVANEVEQGKLQEDLKQKQQQVDSSDVETKRLQDMLAASAMEQAKLEEDLKVKQQLIDSSDAETKRLQDLLSASETEQAKLQETLNDKQLQADSADVETQRLQDLLVASAAEQAKLQQSLNDQQQVQVDCADDETKRLQGLLAASETQQAKLQENLEEKQQQVDASCEEAKRLQDLLSASETEQARLQEDLKDQHQKVDSADAETKHLQDLLAASATEQTKLQQGLRDQQQQVDDADAEAKRLQDLLSASETEQAKLQEDLKEKQQQVDDAACIVRELEDKIGELSEDIALYKSDNNHLNRVVIPELQAKLHVANSEADRCRAVESGIAKEETQSKDVEVAALRRELEEASEATFQANDEVQRLRAHVFLTSYHAPRQLVRSPGESQFNPNSENFWEESDTETW